MKFQIFNFKFKTLLFNCSIVLLLLAFGFQLLASASPVRAQVDIGNWFKMGDKSVQEVLGGDCQDKCLHSPLRDRQLQECLKKCPDVPLGAFVSALIPNIYTIAGVILVFLLIFGGFMFMMNAGSDNPEGVKKAKEAITASLIGFLLIIGSWWIIQVVEIVTGINILR